MYKYALPYLFNELRHVKTNKMPVRPAKTKITNPTSLIRVFAVRMVKVGSLATHWAHSEDSD